MMVNAGRGAGAIAKVEFEPWQPNDVAVFINIGQSNSEGGTQMRSTFGPLSNVYMMRTATRDWSPYDLTDQGGGSYPWNVFRDPGGPRPNIAHAVAEQWQARIDGGETLPDLYVITCAHGGQGFSTKLVANSNRWHTDYKQGPEGEGNPDWEMPVEGVQNINASLYELLYQAVKKGCAKLYAAGKRPRILPIMWVGAEAEAIRSEAASKEIATNYILFHNLLAERWNMPYIPFWQLLLRNPGRALPVNRSGLPIVCCARDSSRRHHRSV